MNAEFYSLSNSFHFIILLYRAENIPCFCGGMQFQDLNAQTILATRGLLAFKSQYFKG